MLLLVEILCLPVFVYVPSVMQILGCQVSPGAPIEALLWLVYAIENLPWLASYTGGPHLFIVAI